MHYLVENYGDCGLDEEIEAVKREWWNVVIDNSWELIKKKDVTKKEIEIKDWQIIHKKKEGTL